jgi:hypothetical protein
MPSPLSTTTSHHHTPDSTISESQRQPKNLLIPQKRKLISGINPSICRTINPSALPAEIQIQRPVFSSLSSATGEEDVPSDRRKIVTVEFDSSRAPQPFLEPEVLQRLRAKRREQQQQRLRQQQEQHEEAEQGADAEQRRCDDAEEEDEQTLSRRREREAEYGSMAVRGRMNVSGRGRRVRDRGRGLER